MLLLSLLSVVETIGGAPPSNVQWTTFHGVSAGKLESPLVHAWHACPCVTTSFSQDKGCPAISTGQKVVTTMCITYIAFPANFGSCSWLAQKDEKEW